MIEVLALVAAKSIMGATLYVGSLTSLKQINDAERVQAVADSKGLSTEDLEVVVAKGVLSVLGLVNELPGEATEDQILSVVGTTAVIKWKEDVPANVFTDPAECAKASRCPEGTILRSNGYPKDHCTWICRGDSPTEKSWGFIRKED